MCRIAEATGGLVTPNDFLDAQAAPRPAPSPERAA